MGRTANEPADNDRRVRAVELRRQHMQYADIGAELGMSKQSAHAMVQRALAEMLREETEPLRTLEVQRLDALAEKLWPVAMRASDDVTYLDQARAVQRLVNLSDRRAKLLGLDAPVEITLTEPIEERAARLAAELAAYQAGLADAQSEPPAANGNGNGHKKNGA